MMENNITRLVRENITRLRPYASARDEYATGTGIFLDANENPYGKYNRYPDPYQSAVKRELASLKGISTQRIFLGNGSDEVIDIAYRIFCRPGTDKALTFTPTYGMYEVSAAINDVELIGIPLTMDFQIDRGRLQPWLSDPDLKLIFICSPNNPTGNLLHQEDIEFILDRFQGVVLIDEAYIDFCPHASCVGWIERYPRLIVIQTLSKAWGLAGVRLGIGYMREEILTYFNKVKAPYNVSQLNQQIALEAVLNRSGYEQALGLLMAEKERLGTALANLSGLNRVYPSDANFFLLEVPDAPGMYRALIEKGVVVRNRHSILPNCLRVTVGTPSENDLLIQTLKQIL